MRSKLRGGWSSPPSRRPRNRWSTSPGPAARARRKRWSLRLAAGIRRQAAIPHAEAAHPAPPESVLALLDQMIAALPGFDRTSVGFPGEVKDGHIITAPNLGTADWHDFALAPELERRWGKPARVLKDGDGQ